MVKNLTRVKADPNLNGKLESLELYLFGRLCKYYCQLCNLFDMFVS